VSPKVGIFLIRLSSNRTRVKWFRRRVKTTTCRGI